MIVKFGGMFVRNLSPIKSFFFTDLVFEVNSVRAGAVGPCCVLEPWTSDKSRSLRGKPVSRLEMVVFKSADGDESSSNVLTVFDAPPGSTRGEITWVRRVGEALTKRGSHKRLNDRFVWSNADPQCTRANTVRRGNERQINFDD